MRPDGDFAGRQDAVRAAARRTVVARGQCRDGRRDRDDRAEIGLAQYDLCAGRRARLSGGAEIAAALDRGSEDAQGRRARSDRSAT